MKKNLSQLLALALAVGVSPAAFAAEKQDQSPTITCRVNAGGSAARSASDEEISSAVCNPGGKTMCATSDQERGARGRSKKPTCACGPKGAKASESSDYNWT